MRIARIAGIKISVNLLLVAVVGLYCFLGRLTEAGFVFFALILHEIAHVLASRSCGFGVDEIELLPFGGVARLKDLVELNPAAEIIIAAVGPATSLFVAGFFKVLQVNGLMGGPQTEFFIMCNLSLGLFNLAPVLPMDGGRVVRGMLAGKMGYKRATQTMVLTGRMAAGAAILAAIATQASGSPLLPLYFAGVFVWIGVERERRGASFVQMRYLIQKKDELKACDVVPVDHLLVERNTRVKQIIKHLVPRRYRIIYIADDKFTIISQVSELELFEALLDLGIEVTMGDVLEWRRRRNR